MASVGADYHSEFGSTELGDFVTVTGHRNDSETHYWVTIAWYDNTVSFHFPNLELYHEFLDKLKEVELFSAGAVS